jgi:uncharacterized damage-inducible protein DinB
LETDNKNILIEIILKYLSQAQENICSFREIDYNRKVNQNSSIGSHLRHCYEFIKIFTDNVEQGKINYDKRNRDKDFEIDPIDASFKIDLLKKELVKLQNKKIEPYIFVSESLDNAEYSNHIKFVSSTIDRELMFLISHTVHHLGIIRILSQMIDVYLPEDFGKATSTISYERIAA